jgi:hypothetical protein
MYTKIKITIDLRVIWYLPLRLLCRVTPFILVKIPKFWWNNTTPQPPYLLGGVGGNFGSMNE